MTVQGYQDLKVWQKAMHLAVACYQVTKTFPKEELYGLVSQIRRAAVSIPANIAEGQARQHTKEFLHFLSVARGSTKEVETHHILSQRLGLLKETELNDLVAQTEEICRMLAGLKAALEAKL